MVTPGQKFCDKCGKEVDATIIICEECKTQLPPDARYCTHCGKGIKKGSSKASIIIQLFFILFIILLVVGIILRKDLSAPTLPNRVSDVINTDKQEVNFETDKPLPYREMSFNTLIFSGEVTHEVELEVPGPTNQAFMVDAVRTFLSQVQYKIKSEDIVIIDLYENTEDKKEYRANFIWVDTNINTEYSFPESGYQPLPDSLYVKWDVNVERKGWFW